MATSPETFSQVKNILRKLDKSIDEARSQRLTRAEPGVGAPVRHGPGTNGVDPQRPQRAKPLPPRASGAA